MLRINGGRMTGMPLWIRVVGAALGVLTFVVLLTVGAVLAFFALGVMLTLGLLAWLRGTRKPIAVEEAQSQSGSGPFAGGSGRVFDAEEFKIRVKSPPQ